MNWYVQLTKFAALPPNWMEPKEWNHHVSQVVKHFFPHMWTPEEKPQLAMAHSSRNIKTAEKTVYHGTCIDNVPSIQQFGLIPSVGAFVTDAYDEYIDAGIELPDLTFAADKQQISSAVKAMAVAVSKKLNRSSLHDITADELMRFGALVVFKGEPDGSDQARGWQRRPPSNDDEGQSKWDMSYSQDYPQVEHGDYFSERLMKPSFILAGQKMAQYLSQFGEWPPRWLDNSAPAMRKKLINIGMTIYRQKHPQMTQEQAYQNVKATVDRLTDSQVTTHFEHYNVKKQAQRYEDINREDYDDDGMFDAAQYFSIGQNDEEDRDEPGWCWCIQNGQFRKKQGGTHSMNFGVDSRDGWRGWYDQEQNMLSIVVPRQNGDHSKKTMNDVPNRILNMIMRNFPGKYDIKVF